jgi:hypothetical protein
MNFRNYSLNILIWLLMRYKTSVCLNGHSLNDGVNHWWISYGKTLWPLGLVVKLEEEE